MVQPVTSDFFNAFLRNDPFFNDTSGLIARPQVFFFNNAEKF
jgi:hypothetical protein